MDARPDDLPPVRERERERDRGDRDGHRGERDRGDRDGRREGRVRERDEDPTRDNAGLRERGRGRGDDRGERGDRGDRGDRESHRGGRDRERDRDREHRGDRGDRDRGDRERERGDDGGRGDRERERKRRSRSRSPRSSRRRSRSPAAEEEPKPEPRKRKTNWDQPPSLDGLGGAPGTVATIPLAGVLPVGLPSVDRQSRRLYVGNIPAGITETEMQEFFNTAMVAAKAVQRAGNPVIAVQINAEKSYAFLEMRAPDEASAGMSFDGIMLHGHALKVRRPKDYIPAPIADASGKPSLPAGAIVATNVPDSPYKIFIGGLPANLSEENVKDLLQTFGPLKAFNLVKDIATGLSKGFAFCEYLDESVTDRACAGLNGMKLGDKQLLVQRASIGAKNPLQSMGMLAPPPVTIPTGPLTCTPANILNLAIPAVTLLASVSQPQHQNMKSRVLAILNMVSLDDLDDDEEFASVYEDVRDECYKFGPVKQIVIPRKQNLQKGSDGEKKSDIKFDLDVLSPSGASPSTALVAIDNSPNSFQQQLEKLQAAQKALKPQQRLCPIGKVYVEFERQEDCSQALHQLAGRRYDGHIIITSLFPEGLFRQGVLF